MFYTEPFCIKPSFGGYTACGLYNSLYTNLYDQPLKATRKTMNTSAPKKLLDQYRDQIRLKQYSQRTEKTYVLWIKEYIFYHHKRHTKEMGFKEVSETIRERIRQTDAVPVIPRKCNSIRWNQDIETKLSEHGSFGLWFHVDFYVKDQQPLVQKHEAHWQ